MEKLETSPHNNLSEFHNLLKDFIRDLLITFPEYKDKIGEEMLYLYDSEVYESELYESKVSEKETNV